ncbi:hypothetical protein BC332_14403 [Capsicum chinense]|nr:hypothetical protein BC332_14403 [Capsicum chinense]
MAAHYGRSHFASEVLKITPALLCHQNKKNETELHTEANEGRIEVVHLLLSMEEHYKETLMSMTDENGDTALHKSARETPLYLETESGVREALSEIFNSCKQSTSSAGPLNQTPLHAAVIQEHTDDGRYLCLKLQIACILEMKYKMRQASSRWSRHVKSRGADAPCGGARDWL